MPAGFWQVLGRACEAAGLQNRRGSQFRFSDRYSIIHSEPGISQGPRRRSPIGTTPVVASRSLCFPPTLKSTTTFFLPIHHLGCGSYCCRPI
ncbi:hypothetical protein ARMSODRAFT_469833 [Armillaria solidipes]|uniref:Uncharacterized protein n=1 Tax=Armillaria solidipes TaxID=1076256 RepID=A0A2H3BE09_9AGAR|nr:hypothetical protein ARMSODRAFT_469833 [Armillaria solidipes]